MEIRGRDSGRGRIHARFDAGTGQITGNYFMANGRVMHLRFINSAMGRIRGGIYVTRYLAFSNLIGSLGLSPRRHASP